MKKLLITVLVICSGLVSCTDLDEKVYDLLTEDKFYEHFTDEDLIAAIGSIYSDMRRLYAGGGIHTGGCWLYTGEETSDLWITPKRGGAWYDGGIYFRLNQHTWTTQDQHFLGNWRTFYRGVNTCNRLLFQFEGQDFDNKENVLAEIKVARAFWYYHLIDFFGNVPLETNYDVPEGYLPQTSSRQDVFSFIVSELEANIPLLKASGYARWNMYAAKHLLARVYLNSEVWTGVPQWDRVVELTDEIMASGRYSLDVDYSTPFTTENDAASRELVLAIVNDEVYHPWGQAFHIHLWAHHHKFRFHANTVTSYWGGFCAPPELIDSYHAEDLRLGKTWLGGQLYDNTGAFSGTVGTPLMCDPWNPRDQGKPLIYTKEIVFDQDGVTTGERDGMRLIKYEIPERALNTLSVDFPYFRYADVYFMKAEALWRKNNKAATPQVVDLINAVRSRAFVNFSGDKVLRPDQLDDERFLQEYAWEFAAEGHRRQQLIRFGVYTTREWIMHQPSQDFRNLFPIPHQEMLANPNLIQNSGY
jgi:hypothetical protein